MTGFLEVTLGGLLGSGIASAIAGAVLLKRNTNLQQQIQAHFSESLRIFDSTRAWREKALSQLLGPMVLQLERTKRAFGRWDGKNLYLEAKIVRDGNVAIRDLLLANGHLIAPHLIDHAAKMIEHYDRWLEEFDTERAAKDPKEQEAFIFVGPKGFPFPREAEALFREEFLKLQSDLYGL